jgi:seryl-tRNA synthetase
MSPPVYHTRVKILTEIIINLSSAKVLSDKSRAALRQELEEAPESLNKLGEDIKKYKDAFKELSELQESLNAQLTLEKFDQKKAASLLDTMVKILGILEVKLVRPGKNHSDSKDRESIVSTTSSNESSNSKKSPKPGPFTNTLLPSNIAQSTFNASLSLEKFLESNTPETFP